jgi:peptidoglycan/xylan/chitin deacetylase (PgdA/CDA1 family)
MVDADRLREFVTALLIVCTACAAQAATPDQATPLLPCVSVLLMGSEAESLAAEEVLFQMGIPHFTTRFAEEALRAQMVLVSFGQVDDVDDRLAEALRLHVDRGGTVVAQKARHPSLRTIFGYERAIPSKNRHEILWEYTPHAIQRYVDTPEEAVLRLGSYRHQELFWTVGYIASDARVLACFEDGSGAITEKKHGEGRAVAIGASLIDLVIRSYLDRDFGVQRVGANAFEPSTDSYMLMLKALYQAYVPHGFTISTAPTDTRGALILTHNIDSQNSFMNMSDFAKVEKRFGTHSTVFVQTKYIADYYDTPFMTPRNLSKVRRLRSDGFEIGSHGVSHTPHFDDIPKGDAVHRPRDYRPQIIGLSETVDATVRGEVRVSKWVLETNGIDDLQSFRAGHLLFNKHLIASLEEADYLFDASMGVYHCACNFPFRQFRNQSFYQPSHIIEIPMTISDYDWVDNLTALVPSFKQVILKNAANGAVTTLLIHPTRKVDKLEALEQILTWLPEDIWVGTVEEFGRFWNSRYGLNPEVSVTDKGYIVRFTSDRPTEQVTVNLNSSASSIVSRTDVEVQDRTTLILPPLESGDGVEFRVLYGPPEGSTLSIHSPGGPLWVDKTTYSVALASGVESYDDYDRRGEAPIMRGTVSAHRQFASSSGIKFWDVFSSRLGEAHETLNEAGITFDSRLTSSSRIWLRAVNKTYKRRFPQSVLHVNEPRIGCTIKYGADRLTYYLDSRLVTAFYSSPDSISDKRFSEVVIEPAVRYRFADSWALRLRGTFGMREYEDENTADVYQTDFSRYGAQAEAELAVAAVKLTLSTELLQRQYTGDKKRTSTGFRTFLETPLAGNTRIVLRAHYLDAEFTEADYDKFFWGEALTSYSVGSNLVLTHWEPVVVTVGGTYRAEDYKQGPYSMKYVSAWIGFSTSF